MKFIDSARLFVKAGNGGNGCIAFLREKYIEFGGPSGGDGGDGGDIIIIGDKGKSTLFDLSCNPHQRAGHGKHGSGKDKKGAKGEDKVIRMPLGSIIIDAETGENLHEVLDEEPTVLIGGGRGGKGNTHFKSSVNRTPRRATPGEIGLEKTLRIDLKLIADVGLIGLPNAGKSTFIANVSKATPKIADYPFTTLIPNLGVVVAPNFETFVIADIPGIIEGAHAGTGLGIKFLKHIQRTSILAFLLDCSLLGEIHPLENYQLLLNELEKFSPDLLEKNKIVLLTKMDALNDKFNIEEIQAHLEQIGVKAFPISAATKSGLEEVTAELYQMVSQVKNNVIA